MTIFLTPEELNSVLADSAFIHKTTEALGWKYFKVSIHPSMDVDRDGFEINAEEALEMEAP